MSYQRFTEGDAYVIGTGDGDDAVFWCVACDATPLMFRTYREIIAHLTSHHKDSGVALERLRKEAEQVGLDVGWPAALAMGIK